jgi:hypothetical protein
MKRIQVISATSAVCFFSVLIGWSIEPSAFTYWLNAKLSLSSFSVLLNLELACSVNLSRVERQTQLQHIVRPAHDALPEAQADSRTCR